MKVFENHRCQIHQPGSQVYLDSDKAGVSHIQTVCHKRWWFSRWYPKSCRVSGWLLQTPPSAYPSNSSVTSLLESQKQLRTDVQMLCNVTFSSFIRDELVLSIWEKVRKGYTNNILVKRLNHFAAEMMNTIAGVCKYKPYKAFHSVSRGGWWSRWMLGRQKPVILWMRHCDWERISKTISSVTTPLPAP